MKILKATFFGNPYIGLFSFALSDLVFIPKTSPKKFKSTLSEIGEVVETTAYFGELLGIHVQFYKNVVLVPLSMPQEERLFLKEYLDVLEVDVDWNALRNHVVFNDKVALLNPSFKRDSEKIEDVLSVEVFSNSIAGYNAVGSLICLSERGGLVGYPAKDEEIEFLRDIFKVNFRRASVNMGSAFLYLGLIYNNNGIVVGENTTGIELSLIEEGLM